MDLVEKYIGESRVDEVMGYKIKAKDKKIIMAFIDGAADGEGNALYIDKRGDKTELRAPMHGTIATRDSKGYISVESASGNVSQTWLNMIKKNTPKKFLKW